jgi:hypothetical protein
LRAKEESNCLPVFQSTPAYCTISRWPLTIGAPLPWISTLSCSVVGGLTPAGTVMDTLPLPGLPVTLGSAASVWAGWVPVMSVVGA